ncbi:hypothetical protein WR25_23051 [Diploscapter pachys]|uniref:C3H1-type domain-containing protein n=1 Tax=Diploscapter pachys TaxID=2018661 RepID=A0A2A2JCV9_9BILA|nr:hypothetical protein WR25_23051 [Diploscapter pachys]
MPHVGENKDEENECAQQQSVSPHSTPSAEQSAQAVNAAVSQYAVFPQQVHYGYPALYCYAPVPANMPVSQTPSFQSMQTSYYQMAPTAQHINQQQQQQQFYPINEYAAQFYQFAQSQPGSVSVPLYNPNQLPFCGVPSVYFPHSQPAAPASTPVAVPGQSQLCSSTPSSEDALHNQPNQQQQQPFVVPVQQLNYCTNQPLYKPAGEPLHTSTPLNGSEWGQSEKDFEQKSTASRVQQSNEQNGQAEGGQTEMCNDASGNCTNVIYANDNLLGLQQQVQFLSLNQAPHCQPYPTQTHHMLSPPGFDCTQGYRYSLPGSLPFQQPSPEPNLHNQTSNSCDATIVSAQPVVQQQTTLNYSGSPSNIRPPSANFSPQKRNTPFGDGEMKMNGVERMQLNDKTAETGQSGTEMPRNEWKGRYPNGNGNANGQEGFRKFNTNRIPFRQVNFRAQSTGFRPNICFKYRDNVFCPNGNACRFLHLDAQGNPTNVNQNWGQMTKGSGDNGLSSENNSNPSGWRQTDRNGQNGRGNNHNNRPWQPQAQGQHRPFNNRQQQSQPQAQSRQTERKPARGLERNQGQEYGQNTRYGAPPAQHNHNGSQSQRGPSSAAATGQSLGHSAT